MTAQAKRASSGAAQLSRNEPMTSLHEQIRRRAYELYEQRGRVDGYDLDDWLQSESELTAKVKAIAA